MSYCNLLLPYRHVLLYNINDKFCYGVLYEWFAASGKWPLHKFSYPFHSLVPVSTVTSLEAQHCNCFCDHRPKRDKLQPTLTSHGTLHFLESLCIATGYVATTVILSTVRGKTHIYLHVVTFMSISFRITDCFRARIEI